MVHFVGAGSGAADLITIRGKKLLENADIIIYAGSLVNPELLEYAKDSAEIYNSAKIFVNGNRADIVIRYPFSMYPNNLLLLFIEDRKSVV